MRKLPINFVGNMEARDAMSGNYDVVVADGFNGNVLLKSIEGMVIFVTNSKKDEVDAIAKETEFKTKLVYVLADPNFTIK